MGLKVYLLLYFIWPLKNEAANDPRVKLALDTAVDTWPLSWYLSEVPKNHFGTNVLATQTTIADKAVLISDDNQL